MTLRVTGALACALVLAATAGCRSASPAAPTGRYVVTSAPIDVGAGSGRLCIAIDPGDPQGIWWWGPGTSGCDSRSTGPTVFHADNATVVTRGTAATEIDASFRLPLHMPAGTPPGRTVDVRLTIRGKIMNAASSGSRVEIARRDNLDIPAMP